MTTMTILEVVRGLNTGILIWNQVGDLLQEALENGQDEVSMEDVLNASGRLDDARNELKAKIEQAKAEGR